MRDGIVLDLSAHGKKVKTKYNAIIIGSGIIGCSIAFELSKKGWKTLNVDNILKQDNRI